jgi:two-component system NarL family response regulator
MADSGYPRRRIRVVAVDDHAIARRGIAAMLATNPDFELVAEADCGEEAIRVFRQHHPDVVLMDLRLKGGTDGIDAIRAICREWSKARILVLTTYGGDENIHRALEAGARGYLIKDTADERLFTAIRAIHEGRRYLPAELAVELAEQGPRIDLTDREKEVLGLMARGLRNKEIGRELGITEGTARTHVENISAKLGVSSRTEAVVLAIQRGFVRVD